MGGDPINGTDPTGTCYGGKAPCPEGVEHNKGGGVGGTIGGQAEAGTGKTGVSVQGSASALVLQDNKGNVKGVVAVTYAVTGTSESTNGNVKQQSVVSDFGKANVTGGNAGGGAGVVVTNAQNADDLRGEATAKTLTTPVFSAQYSESKSGIYTFSATIGFRGGTGFGYSEQQTNTVACSDDGCK